MRTEMDDVLPYVCPHYNEKKPPQGHMPTECMAQKEAVYFTEHRIPEIASRSVHFEEQMLKKWMEESKRETGAYRFGAIVSTVPIDKEN